MFTGLVETTAAIVKREIVSGSGLLLLAPDKPFDNLKYGESIAVNGTCLTLEEVRDDGKLVFHVLEETFKRTNIGSVSMSSKLNLERALAFGDRLGGHLVTGHIDLTAKVISIRKNGDDIELKVEAPDKIAPFLVEKGSVAIDGISLTLVDVAEDYFTVHLIPVTLNETALQYRKPGDLVNLEADLLGKYVHRQLGIAKGNRSDVDMNSLFSAGW